MRISTSEIQRQAVSSLLEQQATLGRLQQQLSTGERFASAAEDPIAAVSVLGFEESLNTTKQFDTNGNVAETRLNVAEVTLDDVNNKLQRVRELTIQAANDTNNSKDRGIIGQEIRLLLDNLVSLANAKDSTGEYLFSGYQGRTTPFTKDGNGDYVYNGDEGQRFVQIGATRQVAVSDSGEVVFAGIKRIRADANPTNTGTGSITAGAVTQPSDYQPHTFTLSFTAPSKFEVRDETTGELLLVDQDYQSRGSISFNGVEVAIAGDPAVGDSFVVSPTANDNVFNRLGALLDTLENAPADIADLETFHTNMRYALNDIDQAMESVLGTQTQLGGRMNAVQSQSDVNGAFSLQLEKAKSELKDLDFVSAISKFNLQMTSLQAAQQSFAQIQGLSLFNYLR